MTTGDSTTTEDTKAIARVSAYMIATYGKALSDEKVRRVLESLRASGYAVTAEDRQT